MAKLALCIGINDYPGTVNDLSGCVNDAQDWSADPWHALTDALKESTGRKGRALFRPLRLALTARESGPEMGPLLKLIGKERALERLTAAAG